MNFFCLKSKKHEEALTTNFSYSFLSHPFSWILYSPDSGSLFVRHEENISAEFNLNTWGSSLRLPLASKQAGYRAFKMILQKKKAIVKHPDRPSQSVKLQSVMSSELNSQAAVISCMYTASQSEGDVCLDNLLSIGTVQVCTPLAMALLKSSNYFN